MVYYEYNARFTYCDQNLRCKCFTIFDAYKILLDIVKLDTIYGTCCNTIPEYRPDLPSLHPLLLLQLPRPYLHLPRRLSVLHPAAGSQGPNGHIGNCAYRI